MGMRVKAKKPISQGAIKAYPAKLLRLSKADCVLALRLDNAPVRGIASGLPVGLTMLLIKASFLHRNNGILQTEYTLYPVIVPKLEKCVSFIADLAMPVRADRSARPVSSKMLAYCEPSRALISSI
jgi:hypothetical protein